MFLNSAYYYFENYFLKFFSVLSEYYNLRIDDTTILDIEMVHDTQKNYDIVPDQQAVTESQIEVHVEVAQDERSDTVQDQQLIKETHQNMYDALPCQETKVVNLKKTHKEICEMYVLSCKRNNTYFLEFNDFVEKLTHYSNSSGVKNITKLNVKYLENIYNSLESEVNNSFRNFHLQSE
jgi:hypothetical protein